MKKFFILSVLVLLLSNLAKSQSVVFFELGGPGLASFNFDTRFTGRNDGIGGRIGVGGFSIRYYHYTPKLFFVMKRRYLSMDCMLTRLDDVRILREF